MPFQITLEYNIDALCVQAEKLHAWHMLVRKSAWQQIAYDNENIIALYLHIFVNAKFWELSENF